jgi:hypothetical protein
MSNNDVGIQQQNCNRHAQMTASRSNEPRDDRSFRHRRASLLMNAVTSSVPAKRDKLDPGALAEGEELGSNILQFRHWVEGGVYAYTVEQQIAAVLGANYSSCANSSRAVKYASK